MNYVDKNTYLTYSFWNGEYHKTVNLNHQNLNHLEIQQALAEYVVNKGRQQAEIQRLERLVDSLLNENANYKRIRDAWQERYDAD